MPLELILVRHGATAAGSDLTLDAQDDSPLSKLGASQARAVAERLAREQVDHIFASPLIRAYQTAVPLASRLDLAIATVDALREIHLGRAEPTLSQPGLRQSLVREVLRAGRWDILPGGESMTSFAARVRQGLATVASVVGDGGYVVIATHGGVIAEACRQATGSRPLAFLAALQHGSITRFRWSRERLLLRGFNDVAHLSRAGIEPTGEAVYSSPW